MVNVILLPQAIWDDEITIHSDYTDFLEDSSTSLGIEVLLPSVPRFGDRIDLEGMKFQIYNDWEKKLADGHCVDLHHMLTDVARQYPRCSDNVNIREVLRNILLGDEEKLIPSIFDKLWYVSGEPENYDGSIFLPGKDFVFVEITQK